MTKRGGVDTMAAARVLHATEAMGGGIVTLMRSISTRQVAQGAEVSVLYMIRPEISSARAVGESFDSAVSLQRIDTDKGKIRALITFFSVLRRIYVTNSVDVVHLHSSIAGALGRVARIGTKSRVKVFYSPHGFAFLRTNQKIAVRVATVVAERLLAGMGNGLLLTAESELEVAKDRLKARRAFLLRTGMPRASMMSQPEKLEGKNGRVTVGMVGRITFQKAPWRFAAVARQLGSIADFIWVGDGPDDDRERWIGNSPVTVMGWLDPQELETTIDSFDIFLFPTLWEGMALSLVQAQGRGIPAVVSNVVGNVDTVVDGETGYVCNTDSALVTRTRQLIEDNILRKAMGEAARTWAMQSLVDDELGVESLSLYRNAGTLPEPRRFFATRQSSQQ